MQGRVLSLHLGLGSGLPKPQVEALELVAGFGAKGDRHAGKDPERAVLVAGLAAYERAQRAGIALPYGALGENLLLSLDPHGLPPGGRLKVGEALLELSYVCTVCSSLSQFDLRLPKLLYGGRGVYARVLESGVVRVGDPVLVLAPAG
ncbi:MOSC domain-containing protein [Thermus sp. FJN-A]